MVVQLFPLWIPFERNFGQRSPKARRKGTTSPREVYEAFDLIVDEGSELAG